MADYSQDGSQLQLLIPLPPGSLLPTRLSGSETLGGSYSFTIDAVAPRGTVVPYAMLLGMPASARVLTPGGLDRYFSGIVWSLGKTGADDSFDHYQLELRPALDRLALTRRTRIFQDMTGLQIIDKILEPIGGATPLLTGISAPRAYCVQYRETDLEFFLRLCSEEGILHYWIHLPLVHTLMLTGNTTLTPPLLTLPYDPSMGGTQDDGPRLHSWGFRQELAPSSVEMLDSHFQLAGTGLQAKGVPPMFIVAGGQPLRFPDAPGPWEADAHSPARHIDGIGPGGLPSLIPPVAGVLEAMQAVVAKNLANGAVSGSARGQGVGSCPQLAPGLGFILQEMGAEGGPHVVTAVEHEVELSGRYGANETPGAAKVLTRVTAAPQMLPLAPWPPRPRPNVGGVHTAVVTGPVASEVNLDLHGRVRVKFPWDREEGASGTWIRVAQCWAGSGYGAVFWPRVGHEVVVAFEGGDPDRPIIIGSVYNSKNATPFPMPKAAYINGFKSCVEGTDGTANYNNILMVDDKALPLLHLQAETAVISEDKDASYKMVSQGNIVVSGEVF